MKFSLASFIRGMETLIVAALAVTTLIAIKATPTSARLGNIIGDESPSVCLLSRQLREIDYCFDVHTCSDAGDCFRVGCYDGCNPSSHMCN
jgi:hypothetical protein